ncbi:MAG: hypothetical protein C4547_13945 [Phycisphaerales bacterium]|nr:MAG: hypothetical protein C4547_13945 [Phycisphaerales bacterium]
MSRVKASQPAADAGAAGRSSLALTAACGPVFEFVSNFGRQVKHGHTPPPQQVRFDAITALRDADDLARNDPAAERVWNDHARAMMVYLIDYKMLNTAWDGADFWAGNPLETDPEFLNHAQALGGEEFFFDCDEIQKRFEEADRRNRPDAAALAELLSLYFVCLRLGFRGQYHDRPQELADYTRRLFTRLPAYATTRDKEMFPQAYRHQQELKVNYNLGMSLTIVVVVFLMIIGASIVAGRLAWNSAVSDIRESADRWQTKLTEGS